jgi:hypothetical protein
MHRPVSFQASLVLKLSLSFGGLGKERVSMHSNISQEVFDLT